MSSREDDSSSDGETRRYFLDLALLESKCDDDSSCLPTADTTHDWLQCFRSREERDAMKPIQPSVKLIRLKQNCRNKAQDQIDHQNMLEFAIRQGVDTSGKWNLKTTKQHVNRLWMLLARGLWDSSTLGSTPFVVSSIKCSTAKGRRNDDDNNSVPFTLCVYVQEGWTHREHVMHVRKQLHDMGADRLCIQPLYWKPELYTLMPFQGKTYVWIDGSDTEYWFHHWDGKEVV